MSACIEKGVFLQQKLLLFLANGSSNGMEIEDVDMRAWAFWNSTIGDMNWKHKEIKNFHSKKMNVPDQHGVFIILDDCMAGLKNRRSVSQTITRMIPVFECA
jgi:ABC-type microcin C transport system duplicated ATPase subunit YejF